MQMMTKFEADVAHPLREDLPELLSRRGMRDPAVRILLLIFIGENRLECSSMEIQIHDICWGKCPLW
jgi:hypothetical protein